MNKRIQELADQAEYYADGIVDQGGEFHEAYTKKFAELMVAELIETVKQTATQLADAGFQQGQSEEEVMKSVNSALAVLDGIVAKFGVES